jgi:predicted ferric reductase
MTTWIVLRSAGIGAYLVLFLSIAWGLVATTGALGRRVSKASAITVHQFLSTSGLALLGVHVAGLLVDPFMPFGVADILVPVASPYRPVATALGMLAMYAVVFVVVTSWMRKRIGTTWWRRSHLLAVPTFGMALAHGLFAGSDSARPGMWWVYVVTTTVLVFLLVVRGLTDGFRPERPGHPGGREPRMAGERAAV